MSQPAPPRSRKSAPCRLYSQGHCRFGDRCRFSHGGDVQPVGNDVGVPSYQQLQHQDHTQAISGSLSGSPSHGTSDAHPRPKRGETPCRAWKAGGCTRGTKCWFRHDIDVQTPGQESARPHKHKRKSSQSSRAAPKLTEESLSTSLALASLRAEQDLREAERIRTQETAAAAARERAIVIAREEAAKTITQLVYGSIVTYSAGLDVPNLITGPETCTLRVRNLAFNVKEDDIHSLLRAQGLDANRFHTVIKKGAHRKPEAHIVTDIATGRALAQDLDGFEFQDEILVVEMSATNSLDGMNTGTGQASEILTISWRVPSARYVAEYTDIAAANAKVRELDRFVYGDRRIRVVMNTQPPGRFLPNLRLNAIKIDNLPHSVTDLDVIALTGSPSVKRLAVGGTFGIIYTVEQFARQVQGEIERAVPGGLRKFDSPPSTCSMEGIVSARAHFSSWDEAHAAHTHLADRQYGTQQVRFRLLDPMYFTLIIPVEQYKAQKTQWDSLSGSIKDRKACTLNIQESESVVRIRLSGSVKEATGALKVRVENLARGDKVEGWHRFFANPGNAFVPRVYAETGAFLRADRKRQSLKVYGTPGSIDRAREMIRDELEKLDSLDYTLTLARNSVGFFVREGIQQLKDTLGENNVKFTMFSRKLTVSGGEEARHALDRLIALSHQGDHGLRNPVEGDQSCPICYDDVSSPHRLGCGHTYCVACLRHFITSALESDQLPLTCLGDEARCRVPIAIPTIQQFLAPASFNRLLETAFDAYIAKHPEEFKPCKTPDCAQIYRAAQAGAAPQTLHCPSCFSAVCNACHEDAHDGMSCAESKARQDPAEQERLNDAWITSQGGRVKKCPRCNVLIEKLEGCNHMSCPCGAHICWRCMGVFGRDTIYDHMHTAHGTIYDNTPAVPEPPAFIGIPVDIEEQRVLFRQAEMRRAAALQNAYAAGPAWNPYVVDNAELARERQRGIEERARQREYADQERRMREQRLLREVEERRRVQEERERYARFQEAAERRRAQERQGGGWNCTIM